MAYAHARSIPGAVATLGVSDRVAFLRRTYGLLGAALLAFAGLTGGILYFLPETSLKFSSWAFRGQWNWLLVLILFMVVGKVAEHLAMSESSSTRQHVGLGVAVLAEAILLQPMLWIVMLRFGNAEMVSANLVGHVTLSGKAASIVLQATLITAAIFGGLTATVFVTKKDFSFLRGALSIASFGALGIMIASMIFGFQLGAIFTGLMILMMAGYILYQTSMIMDRFPPTAHVAAALMLFSTVATLFWYVLRLLMELNRRN